MPQVSTQDFGIATKNAETNNNITSYHLVSRRIISIPWDVQHVYRCLKRTFILPPKYNFSVWNILSNLLKIFIKKEN